MPLLGSSESSSGARREFVLLVFYPNRPSRLAQSACWLSCCEGFEVHEKGAQSIQRVKRSEARRMKEHLLRLEFWKAGYASG